MKFHSLEGEIVTISTDINSAERYQYLALKGTQRRLQELLELSPAAAQACLTEVDARYDPNNSEDKHDNELARELKKNIKPPDPQAEFLEILLGDDPTKTVKVGAELAEAVRENLIACSRKNSDLFAWSVSEMPGIPLELGCHHLAANPEAMCLAQRRRAQSQEKAEAAVKTVASLLAAGFIKEEKYTTWLSNVVLVKKSNGKWRMCVDYTNLYKAGPKDAFPDPSIDKLVGNASGCRLLPFLDAYSGYNQIDMNPSD